MRFYVYVLEAKDLPVKTSSYAKLQVGKYKCKTRKVNGSDPVWNEEFVFRVHDVDEELILSVYNHDDDDSYSKLFNVSGFLVGRVRIPVFLVSGEDNEALPPTWFSLEKHKNGKRIKRNLGKVLLTLSLHGSLSDQPSPRISNTEQKHSPDQKNSPNQSPLNNLSPKTPSKLLSGKKLMKVVSKYWEKLIHKNGDHSKSGDESSDISVSPSEYEECFQDDVPPCNSFEETMELMQSKDDDLEMPENLQGGILVDQTCVITPKDLNALLFAPGSWFRKELTELQGITDLQEGSWSSKGGDSHSSRLTRVVSYMNPPSKLVKAVKATEEQTYVKADGTEFAIFVTVSTPDVPYGNTFKVELLYKIMPGPELSSGEESARLIISWRINFIQSTMMKSIIENGAKQGVKNSFDHFSRLLGQKFKVLDGEDSPEKDQILEALEREHQSDWELARKYFGNLTVLAALFFTVYVVVHILISMPHKSQGLEIFGLDLPDSFGQLITSGILTLLLERIYNMVWLFVQARLRVGSDHGIKSQGDGWVVTVALVEAVNLPSFDSSGLSDPFVVLTCNGKTRTSSVQLQTCDPQWNGPAIT